MTIPAEAIDRARQADIRAIAEQLGARLKKASTVERKGPCPRCGGDDRFWVNVRKQIWGCRGCGVDGDVISLVQHLGGLKFAEAAERLSGATWSPLGVQAQAQNVAKGDPEYERQQHGKARWLWAQRRPLAGTVAETYLRKARSYGGPLPPTLAFLPSLKAEYRHCLISAFAPHPGEVEPGVLAEPLNVQSVQLIALELDGSGKAAVEVQKRTIGAHKGLPIVVSPPNDLLGLSIHEGVEDGLSAYEATGLGSWASGGATFLPALASAVPSYIECVTIVGHQDDAGRTGAQELARLLAKRGIEVLDG
jgi:hypothetical protein